MNSRKTIVRNPGNANNVKFPCFIFSVCQSLILQPHGFNKLKYRENYSHSVFLYATSVTCLIMCYLLKKNNKNNRYKCKTCNSLVHRKCTNLNTLEIFEIKHSKSKNWEPYLAKGSLTPYFIKTSSYHFVQILSNPSPQTPSPPPLLFLLPRFFDEIYTRKALLTQQKNFVVFLQQGVRFTEV